MSIFENMFHKLFPDGLNCPICGREIPQGKMICNDCYGKIEFISEHCSKCGRKIEDSNEYCWLCNKNNYHFDKALSVTVYDDVMKILISKLKLGNDRYIADIIAMMLKDSVKEFDDNIDYLSFVPIDKKTFETRGYNQTERIVKALSEMIDIPVYNKIIKIKETKAQKSLDLVSRMKNLQGAFKCKKKLNGETVLVIDDVMTTGTTLSQIAKEFKLRGASTVYGLTVTSTYVSNFSN